MTAQTARAATPPSPVLLRENIGGIAILTLNRPAARNSLCEALIADLHAALDAIHHDAGVRAVVIAANGPAFSSGHDLKELTARRADADRGRGYFAQMMSRCSAMMQAVIGLPKPVIAAVQGIATAAGCQLVASCDLAVASQDATFATPGVDIGLFCSTPMVALSRNVGRKKALEMLLTGEALDAHEACAAGLVNRVVPATELEAQTHALAERIAEASPNVVGIGKQAFYRQADLPQTEAYALTEQVMTENALAADAQEGICAFLEKRKPRWPG